MTGPVWQGRGKVRARWRSRDELEIAVDEITTQARTYKPLVYEFFRKEFHVRPRWGDFEVDIRLEHAGEAPALDLDNLAKALLDAIKGFVFFDDMQIARLLVERIGAERDRIFVVVRSRGQV
ncbi:MAG: RusA family crossover junction endodeoxyribonuclease [Hyphomonadaceae bacterium]|nr:RusA family crossover junction endodeoxyribonuclease [Hyphomonadaceae bacterium]